MGNEPCKKCWSFSTIPSWKLFSFQNVDKQLVTSLTAQQRRTKILLSNGRCLIANNMINNSWELNKIDNESYPPTQIQTRCDVSGPQLERGKT